MGTIAYEDFLAVDIRAGKIVGVEDFPKARKASYKLWIDFGPLGVKRSSARVTGLYGKDELLDRFVLAVVNFAPKQVADFMSEVLVLGVVLDEERVVLVGPDRGVAPGLRIL
jgi:tRNA-binding protein